MDVFVAVYERWQQQEKEALDAASKTRASDLAITTVLLDHHSRWKIYRQSLRWLAVTDDKARETRTESRRRQLADLASLPSNAGRSHADLVASLLAVERLCDAAADGELADLGLGDGEVQSVLKAAVRRCRGRRP